MGRALGPLTIGIALFAALGLERVLEANLRERNAFVACLGAWIVMQLALIGFNSGGVPVATWVGVVIGTLALVIVARLQPSHDAPLLAKMGMISLIAIELAVFGPLPTVLSANAPPPASRPFADAVPELPQLAGTSREGGNDRIMLHGVGPLNLPMLNGVDGVGGYNPLVPLQYLDFVHLINHGRRFPRAPLDRFVSGAKPQRFGSPLFDAAAVPYVISNRHDKTEGLQSLRAFEEGTLRAQAAALYANPRALPRAYLAFRTARVAGPEDLERALGRGFDGRRITVVEGLGPALEGPTGIVAVSRAGKRPEHRSFAFETERPAVLVVTDSAYPGWRAWVDGEPAPLFRVNGLFRGIAVAAGARRVEMRFEPWTFRAGAALSLGAMVVVVVLIAAGTRTRFGAAPR